MDNSIISEELLMGVAQIAVALIGFSGVVTALGRERGRKWTAAELLQLRTQVEPSMVALFGALVPSTVSLVATSPLALWRVSDAILGGFIFVALARYVWRTRRVSTLWSQRILSIVSVIVLIGLVLGATDVVSQSELVFMLGLWLALIVGAHNFALLLFRIETDDA